MIPISGRAHRKDVATEIVSKMQNSVDEFGQPLFNSNEVLEVSQIETLLSSFMQAQKKKLEIKGNDLKQVALKPEDNNDDEVSNLHSEVVHLLLFLFRFVVHLPLSK